MQKNSRRRRVVVAIAVLLAGLAAAVTARQPAAQAASVDRGAAQAIIEHVGDRRLVLLGETHATREIPDLVEALVTHWAARGPVVLALEMPHDEHAALGAFMASDGGATPQAALRSRSWWQVPDDQHDGRRSEDMLDLIEAMRRLRAQSRDVALLAYDAPGDPGDRNARDRAMARTIRAAHAALANGRLVMLAGNVHAMLERPSYAPAAMAQPAGSWLRDLSPVSVRIDAKRGEYWGCPYGEPRCRTLAVRAAPASSGAARGAYTYHVVLPRFTLARLVAPVAGATAIERPELPARW